MKIDIHLTFDGNCEQAFRFYQDHLRGTIATLLKYGESPLAEQFPAGWQGKILHASLNIGDSTLTGVDLLPKDYTPPKGFYTLLEVADVTEAERIFAALAEGGTVQMPLQQTFWAARFAVLVDRFGIPWEINCSI